MVTNEERQAQQKQQLDANAKAYASFKASEVSGQGISAQEDQARQEQTQYSINLAERIDAGDTTRQTLIPRTYPPSTSNFLLGSKAETTILGEKTTKKAPAYPASYLLLGAEDI